MYSSGPVSFFLWCMEFHQAAVMVMEDSTAFNAGRGSKLTVSMDLKYNNEKGTTKNPLKVFGHVELDASIMDGSTMQAGAVASVGGIRHPVQLARFPFSLFNLND